MRRSLLVATLTAVLAASAAASAQASPKLTADYGFEGNFANAHGAGSSLNPEGPVRACPPCARFAKEKIDGERQGVWKWPEGDGLQLPSARDVLGNKGKTYTFAFLVNLDTVSGYRKLVDFNNRQDDEGWYVYSKSLYPYDLSAFEYDQQVIQAGKWRQITLTRDRDGAVRGYVDGKLIGNARDMSKSQTLIAKKLHFLIDDNNQNSEQSGGEIARLRIWDDALSANQIKHLGS